MKLLFAVLSLVACAIVATYYVTEGHALLAATWAWSSGVWFGNVLDEALR